MSHINIDNNMDKVYITNNHSSYISLDSGQVVYFDGKERKEYQFNVNRRPFLMLQYLMMNNDILVPSDTLYYDVFGELDSTKNIDEKEVDEVKKTLCRIKCIKNSDLRIRKHSPGSKYENSYTSVGYTLVLPEQDFKPQTWDSKIYMHAFGLRPFYFDREMISTLHHWYGSEDINKDISEMVAQLWSNSFNNGKDIELDLMNTIPEGVLVSVKSRFYCKDLFADGKCIDDIKNPNELLRINSEKITYFFESIDSKVKLYMTIGANKTVLHMRHFLPLIFDTDRVFNFRVLGYVDKLKGENKYTIKPICITHIEPNITEVNIKKSM